MPATDLLPGSPALNGRLLWLGRSAEALARDEYWRPAEQLYPSGSTLDRATLLSTTTINLASGTPLAPGGLVLVPGVRINGAAFFSGATAAVTPTNQWCALVDARTSIVLARSVDRTTDAWAANSKQTFTFSGGYTPPEGTPIPAYLVICMVAATPVNLRAMTLAVSSPNGEAPVRTGILAAGHTDPASLASPATINTGNGLPYAYLV